MTGLELLQMIKNYEIKEGTEINVLRVNEDYCCFDVVAKLKYSDNDLFWSPGTFRSSMLWDNHYLFEIVEGKTTPSNIEKIKMVGCEVECKSLDALFGIDTPMTIEIAINKINELIKAVNYLLDTQNKSRY